MTRRKEMRREHEAQCAEDLAVAEYSSREVRARATAYRDSNRQLINLRAKERNLQRYGLTPGQYEERIKKQDGKCAICGGLPGKRSLSVDHDHTTFAVRGLLCNRCNALLGHCRDNPDVLLSAIEYLKLNGAEHISS